MKKIVKALMLFGFSALSLSNISFADCSCFGGTCYCDRQDYQRLKQGNMLLLQKLNSLENAEEKNTKDIKKLEDYNKLQTEYDKNMYARLKTLENKVQYLELNQNLMNIKYQVNGIKGNDILVAKVLYNDVYLRDYPSLGVQYRIVKLHKGDKLPIVDGGALWGANKDFYKVQYKTKQYYIYKYSVEKKLE